MPQRQFTADVDALRKKVSDGLIEHITVVLPGNDQDEAVAVYCDKEAGPLLCIRLLCGDVDKYPAMPTYYLSIDRKDGVVDSYTAALEKVQNVSANLTVEALVQKISLSMTKLELQQKDEAEVIVILDSDDEAEEDNAEAEAAEENDSAEEEVDYNEYLFDDDDYFDDLNGHPRKAAATTDNNSGPNAICKRISRDLRAVRDAGYHFGVINGMTKNDSRSILTVSTPIASLGLGPETLRAWNLDPSYYLVLLIHIKDYYTPLETLLGEHSPNGRLVFQIGTCPEYKPSQESARGAVNIEKSRHVFPKTFVSNSLERFMNEFFLSMARYRHLHNDCPWKEANTALIGVEGVYVPQPSPTKKRKVGTPDSDVSEETKGTGSASLPSTAELSLPLVAMQFALHHLVHCTSYCLSCHCTLKTDIKAIRPFVCDNQLCLYQCINLGLGVSVEHEILAQPKVVDLLVSFCYAALYLSGDKEPLSRLRSIPEGLYLPVLDTADFTMGGDYMYDGTEKSRFIVKNKDLISTVQKGQWIAFYVSSVKPPLPATAASSRFSQLGCLIHGRVSGLDVDNLTIYIEPVQPMGAFQFNAEGWLLRYSRTFDDVSKKEQAKAMAYIMDTIPPISTLRAYLDRHKNASLRTVPGVSPAAASLLQWIIATNRSCIFSIEGKDNLLGEFGTANPMQKAGTTEEGAVPLGPETMSALTSWLGPNAMSGAGQKCKLIPANWVQFCFYQGSLRDEERFQNALLSVTQRTKAKCPTILGWHGSSLANWHSILRTGLDYKGVAHGRSYGDGVYFSRDFSLSLGYATFRASSNSWPNSELGISNVVSLNELINDPGSFVSRHPHYVVNQPDWHQFRFLFVKCREEPKQTFDKQPGAETMTGTTTAAVTTEATVATSEQETTTEPSCPDSTDAALATSTEQVLFFEHARRELVVGPSGKPLLIPLHTMPLHKVLASGGGGVAAAKAAAAQVAQHKRLGAWPLTSTPEVGKAKSAEEAENDGQNQGPEDESDLAFILSDDSPEPANRQTELGVFKETLLVTMESCSLLGGKGKVASSSSPDQASAATRAPAVPWNVTEFTPGSVDYATLPQLPLPSWATSRAQKALSREVARMQEVQASTPAAQLGWYVEFDRVENLFQWIVELHSFDLELPLAKDMVREGVQSIVCELRFGSDFPFSPPFVRIVRPRFLPWHQGGGGHVTLGGAMCMELLTSSGWSPANQVDAVLLQVKLALCNLNPVPARLLQRARRSGARAPDYGVDEAFEAYLRVARRYGWEVPKGLRSLMKF